MSGNRFEFLEFGENGKSSDSEPADGRVDPASLPAAREPQGPRDAEGHPLAQVRSSDLRGYGTSLSIAQQKDVIDSQTRLGGSQPATRLHVAEVIGSRGTKPGQFNFPTGLALDPGGVLYVADSYNHRLQRITPTGGVASVGSRGGGRGQFLSPQGVATDARSAFYVVEQGNSRVQKFSAQGVLELVFGHSGKGTGELRNPTGIAVAPGSGDIFVADTGNSRVQRFDSQGNFLSTLGGRGGIYPPLVSPQSVALDGVDNLYVADTFAHQIVQYDPLGRLVAHVPMAYLHEPRALAWDPRGLLYVTDTKPGTDMQSEGRVQAMSTKTGETRATVGQMNGTGTLARPSGVAVSWASDAAITGRIVPGEVYVADTMNHRVLRFVWT